MSQELISLLIAAVSLMYATVGQAGGTAFLAVMAFAGFAPSEMRTTALLLNIVAAGYATWRLHDRGLIDWNLLTRLTLPSLLAAFGGGLLTVSGRAYFVLTGTLLIIAAALIAFRRSEDNVGPLRYSLVPAALVGLSSGFVSGLSGVGGGVFLTAQLLAFKWASPRGAAAISPPFILVNYIAGIAGLLIAGQRLSQAAPLYACGALFGSVVGTTIGLRWMSQQATRYMLAAVLVFAGVRLLAR